tara:strand:+ start:1851 stop:1985 length:135 start_codon:yes stop_codon:yes gene_type:complete
MYGNPPQGQDLIEPGFFDKQFVISKHSLWLIAGIGALMWYNKNK